MSSKQRVGWGALTKALWAALQWRVVVIWIVLMALPTAIVALPVSRALGEALDHSVHAAMLAHGFHGLLMGDALMQIIRHSGVVIGGAQTVGLVVTLLLSPFLTGVVVTAVQAERGAGLGALMHGGLSQYWRMLRLMLWSLVPYVIALLIGTVAMGAASAYADQAILESSADAANHAAMAVLVVLLVIAHVIMESSRAQVAAYTDLKSATRAFGRGIAMLVRRPLATLGLYLGTSIIGYVLAGLVGMWRIRTDAASVFGFIAAVVLTQLIVAILAWQRTARIGALTMVARATPPRRHTETVAPVPAPV